MSSVRELAIELKVNPNTIQRALSELENNGILYTESTIGHFITHDVKLIEQLHKNTTDYIIKGFIHKMQAIGYTIVEVKTLIDQMEV